jgi:hypothetical protein
LPSRNSMGCGLPKCDPHIYLTGRELHLHQSGNPESDTLQHALGVLFLSALPKPATAIPEFQALASIKQAPSFRFSYSGLARRSNRSKLPPNSFATHQSRMAAQTALIWSSRISGNIGSDRQLFCSAKLAGKSSGVLPRRL